jgi:acyl-coenzyme A synthetase/AMP-(fatty) acid ligase
MSAAAPVVSFVDLIFHHALSRPEKPAIILPDRVVTYDMMAQGILRAEDRIRALELTSDALVCLSFDSPIRHMIIGAALFRLGHPVIGTMRPDESLQLQLPVGAFFHGPGVPFIPGQRQVLVEDDWFSGERRPLAASPPKGFVNEQKTCCVALSSGTTGRPKAISLTIKAFQQWVMNYYSMLGLGTWERLLLLIGLTSSWGFSLAAHALFAGRTLVFANNPRESLHMIAVYGVDAMAATSVQVLEIVRQQAREPVPSTSLRTVLTGGGLLSRSMIADARARLCSSIVNLYVSSEAGGTAFATTDQLMDLEGATGFVAPWAEVEIVDPTGNALPAGVDGILRIRATCQGAPYPPEQAASNDSFRDGWFYPGDLGRITPDGLMILTGRTSGVINVGGLKLAPEAIEDVLRRHPAVTEVAAFGGMGESGIEEISVAVVTNRAVADSHLIDWCAERGLPLTHVHIVEALQKTASGKIHRDLLKRQLLETNTAKG